MTILLLIILAQFIGIVGHWLTRWSQGRTESTFTEYMMGCKAQTIQSLLASLASAFTVYASVPEGTGGKPLVMILIGVYMSGYTLDSSLNRDPNQITPLEWEPKTKNANISTQPRKPHEESDRSLSSVLHDDSTL